MSRHYITTTAITTLVASAAFSGVLGASSVLAQGMPGGGGGQRGPAPTPSNEPEGIAEQAPPQLGALPTEPILPAPKEASKRLRVFGLEGYFRFRSDWMKKFDLGFDDDPEAGGAPFPSPSPCSAPETQSACEQSSGSANTRLRLEPIIYLDERSSVHLQIDVLDNVVMGSTRGGYGSLQNSFDSQEPPLAGSNSLSDSITVKRAWAEVEAPIGLLKFGRQPWHWGMGMVANGGGADPIHGNYNLDGDFGDTVDRLSFSTDVPGTNLQAGISVDWAQTGPTSAQVGTGSDTRRQSWDIDDNDDLDQWLITIAHMDSPTRIADMLADGETVLNYGAFLAYRTQDFEQGGLEFGQPPDLAGSYIARGLTAYIPNAWVHYAKGNFDVEAEAVAVLGSFSAPAQSADTIDIRQFGGVARAKHKFLDGDITLGFEGGFASGDRWDNEVPGRIHVDGAVGLGNGDNVLKQFMFDKDYQVDLIFFRELMGAVSNAMYGKLKFQYDLTSKIRATGAGIVSRAHHKEATPGNSSWYGAEMDADLSYRNGGFFGGIAYGLFIPMGAMNHPVDGASGPGFGFTGNIGEASSAQTFQLRLGLQF